MDDKYYQALRYVGVAGRLVDPGVFTDHFSQIAEALLADTQQEPETSSFDTDAETAQQMSLEELKQYLKKFETNGEELFKVRQMISFHLEALLQERDYVTYKTTMYLLEFQH